MCIRLNNLIQLKEFNAYFIQKFKVQMENLYQSCMAFKKRAHGNSNSTHGGNNNNGVSINSLKKQLQNNIHEQNLTNNRLKVKINQIKNGLVSLLAYRVIITRLWIFKWF